MVGRAWPQGRGVISCESTGVASPLPRIARDSGLAMSTGGSQQTAGIGSISNLISIASMKVLLKNLKKVSKSPSLQYHFLVLAQYFTAILPSQGK